VLLGIVEGLTEFLPVSSTAHLRLSEALLHISLSDGYWKMYSIVIQLGAILCLPVYFWSRIVKFLSTFPHGESGNRTVINHPLSLVLVAFVVTAIPSFLLTKVIGKHLEDITIIGYSLLIGGIVMWIVDAMHAKAEAAGPNGNSKIRTWRMENMSLGQSIWIGICQIFSAVFPGTSRSMATIAAGQIAGMSRASALEFSFFVSMPTMAAATLYTLYKSLREPDRRLANRYSRMDCPSHRLRRLLHRRLRLGRLVYGLGSQAWIHAIRHLQDHRRSVGASVRGQTRVTAAILCVGANKNEQPSSQCRLQITKCEVLIAER
jgi:undecaprenyl-diphosphatase